LPAKASKLKFARYDLPFWLRLPKRGLCFRRDSSDLFLATAQPSATEPSAQAETATPSPSRPSDRLNGYWIRKHPTFVAAALFVLILSGPPRLRYRDPEASLRGEADWVVSLHIVVWGLAGLWVLVQICKRFQAKLPLLRLSLPQILGLGLVLSLAVSISTSVAPALTAFKVYQTLVSILFTQIFAERFGVWASLKTMLWGNALLCIAIAICAFLAPDMVWTPTEVNPDPARVSGDLIAPTGVVSVLAIILLLTTVRGIWKAIPLSLFALFLSLLVLSLMRTAYITAFVFFALVVLKRPNIKPLRRFTYCLCTILLILYAFHQIPSVSQYRSPETISTLSDRTGLWHHLTTVTLQQSPWFGLGYYSASRIYGPEYNPLLGTAHSMFFEVLTGGGLVSFALFLALCVTVSAYAVRLLYLSGDRSSFAYAALFIACLVLGFTGETIDSGPLAITFWCSAAILSLLYKWFITQKPLARRSTIHATS
jgi:O-antigen ligase